MGLNIKVPEDVWDSLLATHCMSKALIGISEVVVGTYELVNVYLKDNSCLKKSIGQRSPRKPIKQEHLDLIEGL